MKTVAFSAVASLALAADAEGVRGALMRHAPFSYQRQGPIRGTPSGDFERQYPDYASPANKSSERQHVEHAEREGDELILKSVKKERAAEKDSELAKKPELKPFYLSKKDMEPVDPSNKKFQSPVFLVDPMFTKEKKDEEIQVFRDNDHAGWQQPLKQTKWPIIRKEVQSFFKVGEDCSCREIDGRKVSLTEPLYQPLALPDYYAPVMEPQYEQGAKRVASLNQHTCYRGDDYGGHNIPFPHPTPPKPDVYYDDCFVDLGSHFGFVNYGPKESHYYGGKAVVKAAVPVHQHVVVKEAPVLTKNIIHEESPRSQKPVCRDGSCKEDAHDQECHDGRCKVDEVKALGAERSYERGYQRGYGRSYGPGYSQSYSAGSKADYGYGAAQERGSRYGSGYGSFGIFEDAQDLASSYKDW